MIFHMEVRCSKEDKMKRQPSFISEIQGKKELRRYGVQWDFAPRDAWSYTYSQLVFELIKVWIASTPVFA